MGQRSQNHDLDRYYIICNHTHRKLSELMVLYRISQEVADGGRIKPAVKHVVSQIEDSEKAIQYIARLLRSFASHRQTVESPEAKHLAGVVQR